MVHIGIRVVYSLGSASEKGGGKGGDRDQYQQIHTDTEAFRGHLGMSASPGSF